MSTVQVKRIHFHAQPGPDDLVEVKFNYGAGAEEIGFVFTLEQANALQSGLWRVFRESEPGTIKLPDGAVVTFGDYDHKLREVFYQCIRELDYVQSVENCNTGLCATALGKDLIDKGMKLLGVKDLSRERLHE